jgi:hypothetical protein
MPPSSLPLDLTRANKNNSLGSVHFRFKRIFLTRIRVGLQSGTRVPPRLKLDPPLGLCGRHA